MSDWLISHKVEQYKEVEMKTINGEMIIVPMFRCPEDQFKEEREKLKYPVWFDLTEKEIEMVKRTVNMGKEEPESQPKFDIPSAKCHLFQVVDVFDHLSELGSKLGLDDNTVAAKCEVTGGDEEGRTLLQRCSLDESWKGFFATRLFLKAIGEPHKGDNVEMDTDRWIGRQFYAVVAHNQSKGKTYANIDAYDYTKPVEQYKPPVGNPGGVTDPKDIQWDN